MSEIIACPAAGATRAPSRSQRAADPAPAPAPQESPARPPLSESDCWAVAVGSQIYHLLAPVVEGPFDTDSIPAFGLLHDATNLAWDLHNLEAEWQGAGAAPTAAQMIPKIQERLHFAMIELVACPAQGKEAALLYSIRLLVGEALTIATCLRDAHAGLPDSAPMLSAMTGFQDPAAGLSYFEGLKHKGPITADTPSHQAGEFGERLLINGCYDIEQISDEIILLADEAAVQSEFRMAALLRCYGARVKELNGYLMSHLDRDGETLTRVQRALYSGAKTLPKGTLA